MTNLEKRNRANNYLSQQRLSQSNLRLRELGGSNGKSYSGVITYDELLSLSQPNQTHTENDIFVREQRPTEMARAIAKSRELFNAWKQGKNERVGTVVLATSSKNLQVLTKNANNELQAAFSQKLQIEDGSHRTLGPAFVALDNDPEYMRFLREYELPVEINLYDSKEEAQSGFLKNNDGAAVTKSAKLPIEESIRNGLSYRLTRTDEYNWSLILGDSSRGHLFTAAIFADGTRKFEEACKGRFADDEVDKAFLTVLSTLTPFTDNITGDINDYRRNNVLFTPSFWQGICQVAGRVFFNCHGNQVEFEKILIKAFSNFANGLWNKGDITWQGVLWHSNMTKITGAKHFTVTEQFLSYKFGLPLSDKTEDKEAQNSKLRSLKRTIKSFGHRSGDVLGEVWV